MDEFVLGVNTENLYNLKEIPCFSLYLPCFTGKISRRFTAALERKELSIFAASAKKKMPVSTAFQPLWKEKTINFCLFSACFKISIVLGKLKAP